MDLVRLGRTNVEVSVAGLGCGGNSRLGMARGATIEEAADLVRHALDLGITFIDTAMAYGTEAAVGRGVAGRRHQVFISTKSSVSHGLPASGGAWLSPDELGRRIDDSLTRLGVDHIDLFNLHAVQASEYAEVVERLAPELRRQQQAGKIRFLGITELFQSEPAHEMLIEAVPDAVFDVVMVGFNLLNPSARRTVYPLTRAHDVGTQIMFAVRRALSQPDVLREVVDELIRDGVVAPGLLDPQDPLNFLTRAAGVGSVVEAAYRFCRHEPGVQVVLTGTGHRSHLTQNVAAIMAPPLPQDVLSRLEQAFGHVDSVTGA
jgi:aryl-alcohol dehydrogenase-like predicted oxidoreductase